MSFPVSNIAAYVTGEPESFTTRNGTTATKFRIGVKRSRRKDDDSSVYFNVTDWNGVTDRVSQYIKRGSQVLITGNMTFREYTAQTGEIKESKEIDLFAFEFAPTNTRDSNGNSETTEDRPF